jgi:hypothetical protein
MNVLRSDAVRPSIQSSFPRGVIAVNFKITRRRFLSAATAAGAFSVVPRHVLGGPGYVAPSEKITLAHIGMGTQGFAELGGLLADPRIQIVAVCDPNTDSDDYVEWGKHSIRNVIRGYLGNPSWREGQSGCPGGRDVGRQVVDAYYARERGAERFTACAAFADFRELLEQVPDLDAVKVMTPDHLHAAVSVAAMRRGKHVLMHKPIANRLREARVVIETARETQRATHLLAYGSGTGNARICAQINAGAIGTLREVHNWSNRPVWPQYPEIPRDTPPVPRGFDWDLWLGPAIDRPYHPNYTHTVFRGWYDFGGGSMADMGIYSLWPVFTELDLPAPLSAQAWASHTCTIEDQVSRPVHNAVSYPAACTIRLQFARGGDGPDLDLFWYDGGMRPRLPEIVETHGIEPAPEGMLFVGEEGAILAGFHGQDPQRITHDRIEPLAMTARTRAESRPERASSGERQHPWVEACRGGDPSPGSFLHAGPISDAVNLGTVALRAGRKVLFDSQAVRITNDAAANQFLTRDYRPGWEM